MEHKTKKSRFSSLSSLKKLIPVIIAGFIGGAIAALVISQFSANNDSIGSTKIDKVSYKTTTSTTKAVKKVQDAVVSVLNYQESSSSDSFYESLFGDDDSSNSSESSDGLELYSEGSGVIYKKSGNYAYIVTNNHVVSGEKKLEIQLASGKKVKGTLVGADSYSDLAVIKIDSSVVTTVAKFGNSSTLTVGEPAIAIGSPLGTEYANSVTEGIVSSLNRTVNMTNDDGENISINAIQTDAAINPGNSGGPLVNIEGQVIGINSSKISTTSSSESSSSDDSSVEGMGFAIPSNDVVTIINQLEENGSVTRPALGIQMIDLSNLPQSYLDKLDIPSSVTEGVVVMSVQSGMPAEGQLKKYDVITKVDNTDITSTSDLQSALYKHKIGDSIKITFYRGSSKKTVTIKLTQSSSKLASSSKN